MKRVKGAIAEGSVRPDLPFPGHNSEQRYDCHPCGMEGYYMDVVRTLSMYYIRLIAGFQPVFLFHK